MAINIVYQPDGEEKEKIYKKVTCICERCGYDWRAHNLKRQVDFNKTLSPLVCPRCKTNKWNKKRGHIEEEEVIEYME